MTDEVETVRTDQATTQTQTDSNTTPATTQPDEIESKVKAAEQRAREEARREAQSAKDREIAQLHRHHQEQLRSVTTKAKSRLQQLGDTNPDSFETEAMNEAELTEYRAWRQQQAAVSASRAQASDIASAFGLKGDDPRLLNAASWDDFRDRCKKAAAEDARKEREAQAAKAAEEERKGVNDRIASGNLGTLNVTSAGKVSSDELVNQYKKEMLESRGKGIDKGKAIKEKYRKLKVDVDTIVLR